MTSHPTARHTRYDIAEIVVLSIISLFVVWYVVSHLIEYGGPIMGCDAHSYMSDLELLRQGRPGIWRTPGYLLLLLGSESIMNGNLWWLPLQIFQTSLFLVSVICFYSVCRRLVWHHRRIIALTFTSLYGACHPLLIFALNYTPEFICVPFVVIYFKSLLDCESKSAWWRPIYSGFLVIVLITLKPIFIYLIAVTAAWWVWIYRRRRVSATNLSVALLMMVLASGLTLAYRVWNHKANGYNVLTLATVVNDWSNLYLTRGVIPEEIENPELRDAALKSQEKYGKDFFGFATDLSTTMPEESIEYLRNDKLRHPDNVALYFIEHFGDMVYGEIIRDGFDITTPITRARLTVPLMFLIVIAWGGTILFKRPHYKVHLNFQEMVAISLVILIAIVAYGAYGDWSRLLLPAIPNALWLGVAAASTLLPRKYTKTSYQTKLQSK